MNRFVKFAAVALLCVAGCTGGKEKRNYSIATNGNSAHGKELIQGYGCGACHIVPGINTARGLVGPPLYYIGYRTMIAGELPNSEENLTRWIQHPRDVNSRTAMPDLGLSADQAQDIAAYLYSLPGPKGNQWSQ